MKRFTAIWIMCCVLALPAAAQVYAGFNAGPLPFRTADFQMLFFPKNEDWIAVHVGGGATLKSPFLLTSQKDCVDKFRNRGYHFRAGFRNGLTDDHHKSHLFWGLNVIYSNATESGITDTCFAGPIGERVNNQMHILSGALLAGYTWNPLHKKTIHQKFLLDFGMQIGFPVWQTEEFLGRRQYVSGIGLGGLPIRSVHLELIAVFRWELWHNRYGYKKPWEFKRK